MAEIVVITGASAGIGRATAREFARRGCGVALLARGRDGLEAAAREVEALGGEALVLPTDVADADAVDRAADLAAKHFGRIDIWVNNAFARLFGRAANDKSGGWLFGMAFGFLLWSAGAVAILPILGKGQAPAGEAAIGVLLSLVAWGAALGLLFPFVHKPLHQSIEHGAERSEAGPGAAASGGRKRRS